jgi:DNA-binding NtrC family response regulator
MPPRTSELAPYFTQLRDAERRLLGVTLVGCNWDYRAAAEQLGIGHRFLKARVVQLGGILPNTERNEPPPPIWKKKAKP